MDMTRHETYVEDGTVYVGREQGNLVVGDVDDILEAVGGPSWTITYTDAEKARHPEMDTSDEGLIVDVLDMVRTMTHGERFVETLAAHPVASPDGEGLSPRTGLFVGKLLENLENGLG